MPNRGREKVMSWRNMLNAIKVVPITKHHSYNFAVRHQQNNDKAFIDFNTTTKFQ